MFLLRFHNVIVSGIAMMTSWKGLCCRLVFELP